MAGYTHIKPIPGLILAGALLAACLLLAAGPAQADAIGLGEAGNYNVFVFDDFQSSSSDTQGRLAAGGNVSLHNYGLGSGLPDSFSGSSMVVGGNLFYRNGQVKAGNVDVAGSADVNQTVGTGANAAVRGNVSDLSVSFADEKQRLTQLSQNLSQLTPTGNAQLVYSTLQLSGDGTSGLQVFNVNASDLAKASGFSLATSIPQDSSIILNIIGGQASMKNQGQQALSGYSDRVIFNFIDATLLSLSGIGVQGTILAPNAEVTGNNGNIDGTLIAKSFKGNLEFHNNPSTVTIPNVNTSEVPEPGTLLLLGPALAGAFLWRRRKRIHPAKA